MTSFKIILLWITLFFEFGKEAVFYMLSLKETKLMGFTEIATIFLGLWKSGGGTQGV